MEVIYSDKFIKQMNQMFNLGIFWRLRRFFIAVWRLPRTIQNSFMAFYQLNTRGFTYRHLWSLNEYLGKHIANSLQAFKDMDKAGVPGSYCNYYTDEKGFLKSDVDHEEAIGRFNADIQDMIDGFNFLSDYDDGFQKVFEECNRNYKLAFSVYEKRRAEAKLKAHKFIEHIEELWD